MSLDEARALAARVDAAVRRVIIGQHDVVEQVLIALLAGGHGLLQGVPGLAKTLLVRTLARSLDLRFSRIQFTPDLMPADVTGTEVIEEDRATGHRDVRFVPGPIFAQVILADEINRTPPRTQAALLEAMQEAQVTIAGVRHPLELPFFVLATENPIEQEGTYPLPEAQLDRFMLNIVMGYPTAADERAIVAATTGNDEPDVAPVAGAAELLRARHLVREVPAADNVIDYATRLVRATRPAGDGVPAAVAPLGPLGRRAARRPGAGARRQGPRRDAGPAGGVARRHPRRRPAGAAPPRAGELPGRRRGHHRRAGRAGRARRRPDARLSASDVSKRLNPCA